MLILPELKQNNGLANEEINHLCPKWILQIFQSLFCNVLNAECLFLRFCLQGKAGNNSNFRPKPAFKTLFETYKKEIGKRYE